MNLLISSYNNFSLLAHKLVGRESKDSKLSFIQNDITTKYTFDKYF